MVRGGGGGGSIVAGGSKIRREGGDCGFKEGAFGEDGEFGSEGGEDCGEGEVDGKELGGVKKGDVGEGGFNTGCGRGSEG